MTGVEVVSPPSGGEYFADDTIQVAVTFSEDVAVTGTPTFPLRIGSNTRAADYQEGESTASRLVFAYVVGANDSDDDGIASRGRILDVPAGAAITRPGGDMAAAYPAPINLDTQLKVIPTVTAEFAAASYTAAEGGSAVKVKVNLNLEPARRVDITISVTGNDGASDGDYTLSTTSLTFDADEKTARFTVMAAEDSDDDDGESLTLGFQTLPDGVSPGDDDTATVILLNIPATVEVPADWDLIPSGIDTGGRFRLLFVTSNRRDAASSDIAAYNSFVRGAAADGHDDIQAYSDHFAALGSTGAVDARNNTGTDGGGVPIYWLNGPRAANNYGDFYDGSWDHFDPVRFESGATGDLTDENIANRVWTGTGSDGLRARDGGNTLGSSRPEHGSPGLYDGEEIGGRTGNRDWPGFLYGLSFVFQVALSDDADLDDLTVDGVSVAGFAADTTSHTHTVGNASGQVTVVAVRSNDNATMAYSTTDADDNAAGHQMDLEVGDNNEVTITVTAQDGVATRTYTLTIVRTALEVEFAAASYTAAEGAGAVTVTVNLSSDPGRTVALPISVTPKDGADAGDYTLSATSLTFGSGDTSASFTVTAEDDDVLDGGVESLTLALDPLPDGWEAGARTTTTVSLFDNEIPVTSDVVPFSVLIGDEFRLLFVTSGARDATSSNIADYNAFVQDAAAAGHSDIQDYSGQFRALASTADVDAIDNTATNHTNDDPGVRIWWLNSFLGAANHYVDFYDGSWDNRDPGRDENGVSVDFQQNASGRVWTGTSSTGAASLPLGSSAPGFAEPAQGVGRELAYAGSRSASSLYRLYGLSFVLNAVPPPDRPYVTGVETVEPPESGVYRSGDTIKVAVTFSEEVAVTGAPTFQMRIGSDTRQAAYQSGESTEMRLVFTHAVTDDDYDSRGISRFSTYLRLPVGASITRQGDDSVAAYVGSIVWQPDLRVNEEPSIISIRFTSPPSVASHNPNYYGRGEDIEFTVTFSAPVRVTGDVRFHFVIINKEPEARLVGGDGTDTLKFVYTVEAGDRDANGIAIYASTHRQAPFRLETGQSITDPVSGRDADLTHGAPYLVVPPRIDGALTDADATLSALSLSDITLDPFFSSYVTQYTASAEAHFGSTTVTARPSQNAPDNAAHVNIKPGDAFNFITGHQVALGTGDTVITVVVTSTNRSSMRIYTITVTREAADATVPSVSRVVAGDAESSPGLLVEILFDEDLDRDKLPDKSAFTLTVDGSEVKPASVRFHPSNAALLYLTPAVAIAKGATVTVAYDPPGTNDDLADAAGNKVAAFTGLEATNSSTALVVEWTASSHTAREGGPGVTVTLVLRGEPDADVEVPIEVSGASVGDYSGVPTTVTFDSSSTSGGRTTASFTVTAEDDEVYDGDGNDETITLSFGTLPSGVSPGAQPSTTVALVDNEILVSSDLVPSSFKVGDEFRLLFVTNNRRNGSRSDIAVYDTHVQTDISDNGSDDIKDYVEFFRVLGSTAAVDARDHTGTTYTSADKGVPIWWVEGPKAADDYEDFYDNSWDHRDPGRYSDGDEHDFVDSLFDRANSLVYTGTGSDGTESDNFGADTGLGRSSVGYGRPVEGAGNELQTGAIQGGGDRLRFYGLSHVLRAAAPADTPYVTGVELVDPPANGNYATGGTITVAVTFSEDVSVSGAGTPTFPLLIGSNTRQAQYQSAASTATRLVFTYDVINDDSDRDGISNAERLLDVPSNAAITRRGDSTVEAYPGPIPLITDLAVNVDTTAPTVSSATVSADGTSISLVFNEDLDASGSAPTADAFEVTVDGGTAVNPASVAFHTTDADTITLTMATADTIAAGATVTVDYTKPTTNPLKDAADNEVADFTGQAVANRAAADIEVSWASSSYAALEGHPGTTVTLVLSDVPAGDVTVPISTALGGGASDDDYSGVPASVTFDSASVLDGDGRPTESFTVVATDDDFHDGDGNDETVTLSFGTPTGVTAGTQETATVGLIDNEVPATSDLIPDGTAIGEGFRLLFVTSNKRDATSTDIDDYNRHVQSRAKNRGHDDIRPYSSQFQALASTEAVNARDNTATDPDDDGPGEEIWWLDGPKAADHYRDFYDNTWDHQNPGREEDGDEVDFEDEDKVWTGTDKDGTTRFPLGQNPSGFAEPFETAGELFQGGSTTRPKYPLYGLSYALYAAAPADTPSVTRVETVDLPDGPYRSGDTIKVRVIFSEAVTVNGAPTFPMEIGSDTRQAEYLATESTGTGLVFTHLVTDADYDNSSAGISNAELVLELPSGTSITRASDSTVDAYPGSIVWEPDRKVNRNPRLTDIEITSDPRSGSDSDTYGSREVIEFTVTFDVPVTVTGDATEGDVTLRFFIGEGLNDKNERYAVLSTSDGTEQTEQLVFTYTVVSLDTPRDGGVVFVSPENHSDLLPFDLMGEQSIEGRLGRNAKLDTIKSKRTYPGHMVNGTLTPPPAADTSPPENLRAFAGKLRIDLEWDEPSAGAPAAGYRVRWRKSSESGFAASATADVATGTEYTISGLSDGEAHVVQVASLDASSDPGDWVEAQATVGRPKAVSNLTVQTRSQDFRLSWDAPDERGAGFLQDSANNPVLVYRVSWEETGQESDAVPYQKLCQTGTAAFDFYEYYDVEQSGNTITFKLRPPDNGEVYSFAVEARFETGSEAVLTDCRNQSNFGPQDETTATATEDAAMASEEDHVALRAALEAVVDDREENWPWLRTAWDHASAGTVQAADLDPGTHGNTGVECHTTSNSPDDLGGCPFGKLEIDIDWDLLTQERFEYLAVHELAHVWTLVTDLHDQDTRAPVGRALLYFFGQEYEGDSAFIMALCAKETLADALSHVAEGVAPADLTYYGNVCFSDGRTEPNATSEAVALHAMHPSGTDPNDADTTSSWFTDTFTGDAASDDAWAAVSDIGTNGHRFLVMNLLQDEFNGLCSIKAGNVAASEDSDVISPWTDGGCEPDAPTGVTATAGSAAGSIDVSWTAPAEAGGAPLLGYTVQWKVHVQSWPQEGFISPTQQAVIDDSAATSHTIAGLTPGLEYTVRVRARNSIGDGVSADQSVIAASAARSAPPPPKNVRAVEEKGGVRLTWQAPDGATVTGYRIERRPAGEDGSGPQRSHGQPRDHHTLVEDTGSADTGYTDESAEQGVEYEYRVTARNESGPGEGSDWVRAGPASASNAPATGAPTISGTAQVGETLTADITGIADADGLSGETFAYQWVSSDGTTDTDMENATGSTYKLVAADQGRSVKVRVTFTDDGGNEETLTSAPTAPVLGDGRPGAPRNLTATPGDREITLSWEPPADNGNAPATRYRIEWRIEGKDYDKNDWGTARSTTYTTTDQANLANGVKYFFRVKAGNGNGNSYGPYGPASEEVSATPTSGSAVDLGTPVLSDTETLHHGMVRLDWQDIEDAGWYVVQYYHVEDGEWLDLPAEGVDIAFHGSSAVVSNLHGLSWLRVGAMSCAGASEWSQIEQLFGTNESDWEGVPVPEVEEGDEIEPCPVVLGTPVLSDTEDLHHGMVQLDWQDIEDAGWYVVQYYHVKGGEWLDLPAERVDIAFHGSSAVVSNLHGLSWLRVRAMSCAGASEWSQIEQLFGTNASDWDGVPVPEVEESDEIEPCSEDADTPDNSPATGAPTISGTAQVRETLTADTSGIADADGLTNVSFTYQWLADDTDIAGASGSTYTLTDSEESKAIKVEVSFTDDAGNDETLTTAATDAVAAASTPNSPATGAPTISGTIQVGETLTADTSGVSDADGLSSVQYEYQWLADDSDISGATNATYTLVAADEGKVIKVRVSFTDDADNEETLTSAATGAVDARPNTPATGAPTISGTAQVGETLTADTSGIADTDGLANATFSYQWLADDTDIAGATGLTYTLTDSEESNTVKVQVAFTDNEGNSETLTSAATDPVAARPNSPATGAPTIAGTAQVGQTVTADTSGIADADGLSSVQYEYQWLADDSDISGATNATYTLTDSEESKAITVQVSFTDDADNEETLTSAATAAVAGAQPTEPPDKPMNLSATATHDSVTLTWDDPGDDSITGYVILRRIPGVDPEGHFDELVADTGTAATTYTDNTVSAETRYTYRIKAINGAGTSERSRWSHIDTPAAPVPDKPTGLEATESHGQVVLTWDDPGDDSITGYVILRRVRENNTGGDFSVLVADTGTAAATYTDDTVAASATYTYRIKAINEHGTSERSRWYHIDIPEAP